VNLYSALSKKSLMRWVDINSFWPYANNYARVRQWLGSHSGAGNWITQLDVCGSDPSAKLWTHFDRM